MHRSIMLVTATLVVASIARADAVFTPIGDLPGGTFDSAVYGIAADGTAATGVAHDAGGSVAFVWTPERGLVRIGPTDAPTSAYGVGVTSRGTLVALSANTTGEYALNAWSPITGLTELGDVSDPGGINYVASMADDGWTIVGDSLHSTTNTFESYRWTAAEGLVGLGTLPGGTIDESITGDCSSDGSIIVGASTSALGFEAYRWESTTGMVGLGDLPGGPVNAWATGVDATGATIVGYGTTDAGHEAFRWTEATGMVSLGDLPGGAHGSWAVDVSADGSVIVGFANDTGEVGDADAFIWTADAGMVDLRTLLVTQYGMGDELSGWDLAVATSVSADGSVIGGWGTNPAGDFEGWIIRLPDTACSADLNGDGAVNATDLATLLAAWGTCP
ncbi:MAG: hypothetical protein KDA25_07400 [Phycisphaerales bacterium]|nr:hypothetical protein [Phycisphaerales bacterium]